MNTSFLWIGSGTSSPLGNNHTNHHDKIQTMGSAVALEYFIHHRHCGNWFVHRSISLWSGGSHHALHPPRSRASGSRQNSKSCIRPFGSLCWSLRYFLSCVWHHCRSIILTATAILSWVDLFACGDPASIFGSYCGRAGGVPYLARHQRCRGLDGGTVTRARYGWAQESGEDDRFGRPNLKSESRAQLSHTFA